MEQGSDPRRAEKSFLNPQKDLFRSFLNPDNPNSKSISYVNNIVDYLIVKLKSPGYEGIFRKAAWRLDRRTIDTFVEIALTKTNPRAYFITCVKNDKRYTK